MDASKKRYVRVAPPTVHAGVGNALRQAFSVQPTPCNAQRFDDLLARLR